MTDTAAPQLLTLAEVRGVLGIGRTKLYELINSGQITTIDVSRNAPKAARRVGDRGPRPSRRVEAAELQRYIADSRITAAR